MTASTPDLPSYRTPSPDEGHEALRAPLAAAVDDLSDAIGLIADTQAGVSDAYFVSDLLLGMVMDNMATIGDLSTRRQLLAARSIALPVLTIGTSDLTVPWGSNLGSANYQVEFASNTALLDKVAYEVKTTYATSCVLTLRTTVAIPLGAVLELTAVRYT